MKFVCRACKREFDVHGWLETVTNWYPPVQYADITPSTVTVADTPTNYSTSTVTKIPICPFCSSAEIEEANKE